MTNTAPTHTISSTGGSGSSGNKRGAVSRLARYVGGKLKTSFAVVGVVAAAGLYYEYKTVFPNLEDDRKRQETVAGENGEDSNDKKERKKVLVVPFHRIQLKDKHERDFDFSRFGSKSSEEQRPLKLEVRELVDLIHHAASDPDIVALYGTFGHGSELGSAGWADLEEIRNALKVFREAHRSHFEPNLDHKLHQVITRIESKPLYAYADTFNSMDSSSYKDYYLASIFTHLHMQEKGELNLLGMLSEQFFLKGFLDKYGVTLNVFKQGEYKNFPNMFTEAGFTKAHRENVRNILDAMDADVCADITTSRSKALLASWLNPAKRGADDDIWKRIHESGPFPATTAWNGGLIDYLPRRDPLPALIVGNQSQRNHIGMTKEWKPHETNFVSFKAQEAVTLTSYAKKIRKLKASEERKKKWTERLSRHPNVAAALSAVGVFKSSVSSSFQSSNKEQIALLYVQDAIGDSMARKTVNAIRKIGQDPKNKCVVVRVCSPGGSIFACETISQELKGLNLPVVVSFGNVAASGGYYISAAANRVFASNKSITGSIGVFGIRADLTGLTDMYGIKVQHEASGNLSALFSPFHPMSKKMKSVVSASIDRYYDQFKGVVSEGRGLSLEDVERIGRGRVWTGDQAKRNGLVDELGGLYRAIAYARRNFTESDADVVVWPKKLTLFDVIREVREEGNSVPLLTALSWWFASSRELNEAAATSTSTSTNGSANDHELIRNLLRSYPYGLPGTLSGAFYAVDEEAALRCLVDGVGEKPKEDSSLSLRFW